MIRITTHVHKHLRGKEMNGRHIFFGKLLGMMVITGLLLASLNLPSYADEPYDEETYGPETPITRTKPVTAVVFTHKRHTLEAGLECDSCHDDIFQMEAGLSAENDDFNMASLYAGKYCGTCHDGETAFSSNSRCTACHIGVQAYNDNHAGKNKKKSEHHE